MFIFSEKKNNKYTPYFRQVCIVNHIIVIILVLNVSYVILKLKDNGNRYLKSNYGGNEGRQLFG